MKHLTTLTHAGPDDWRIYRLTDLQLALIIDALRNVTSPDGRTAWDLSTQLNLQRGITQELDNLE